MSSSQIEFPKETSYVTLDKDPNNISEITTFFADLLEGHLNDYNFPGITLSVVNATDILYLKGYGYANLEESIPVNPNTSMFRTASISKLFTWTAVMQLYEVQSNALVCDASSAERSQVIFGALLEGADVTIAVFTGGRDPARAKRTRDRIAGLLDQGRESRPHP